MGGGSDLLKLDDALAALDDFVAKLDDALAALDDFVAGKVQ